MAARPRLVVLMGPSGAGKSTVGQAAARLAGVPFFEGDDFHPPRNKAIIAGGGALTDEDRAPWIDAIGAAVRASGAERAVIACSALHEGIRSRLAAVLPGAPLFVLLDVPRAVLADRLAARRGHFAGPSLLQSQLDAMDAMAGVIRIDGISPPEDAAARVARIVGRPAGV